METPFDTPAAGPYMSRRLLLNPKLEKNYAHRSRNQSP